MFRTFCCCAALLLAACNPAAIRDNAVKQTARAAAETRFAPICGTVSIPDRAFLPIDMTASGHDYVLSFARADCGRKTDLWIGKEGSLFQVWTADQDRPRLALEQNMEGFRHDYKSAVLITDQRGGACGTSVGAEICRVVYRWNPAIRALVIVRRERMPAEALPVPGRRQPGRSASLSGKNLR